MASSGAVKRRSTAAGSEQGSITGIAILVSAILLLMGLSFLGFATTDNTMVANEISGKAAFNLADAGIDHARRLLITVNHNAVLQNTLNGQPFRYLSFSGAGGACTSSDKCPYSLAGGTYYVGIANNMITVKGIPPDPSGSATNDTDGTLILTSTGTYRGATRQIETTVTIPSFPSPPGAVTAFGPNAEVELETVSPMIDGYNYDPPSLPCTGAACASARNGSYPAVPGVVFNSNTATLEFRSPTQVDGANPSKVFTDPSLVPDLWQALANALIPKATRTVTGGTISGTQTWGTAASPEITYITGGTVNVTGSINGAGILIVNSSFVVTGTFNFEGLVLSLPTWTLADKDVTLGTGTVNIFGSYVTIPPGPTTGWELELAGNSSIKYSKVAVDYARTAAMQKLNTTLLTWREVP